MKWHQVGLSIGPMWACANIFPTSVSYLTPLANMETDMDQICVHTKEVKFAHTYNMYNMWSKFDCFLVKTIDGKLKIWNEIHQQWCDWLRNFELTCSSRNDVTDLSRIKVWEKPSEQGGCDVKWVRSNKWRWVVEIRFRLKFSCVKLCWVFSDNFQGNSSALWYWGPVMAHGNVRSSCRS